MTISEPISVPVSDTALRTALFVDSDNLPVAHAGRVLRAAGRGVGLARVYGNMELKVWAEATGFRKVHAGSGKNAADMLLCIDAVDAWHSGCFDRVVIATSDRDFSHLAHWLRERGAFVLGLGEEKALAALRHACSQWVKLVPPQKVELRKVSPLESAVIETLRSGPLTTSQLNQALGQRFKISGTPEKNWARWIGARPDLFKITEQGVALNRAQFNQTRSIVTLSVA